MIVWAINAHGTAAKTVNTTTVQTHLTVIAVTVYVADVTNTVWLRASSWNRRRRLIHADGITNDLCCGTCNTGVIDTDTAIGTRTLSMALTTIAIGFWTPVWIVNILTGALLGANGLFGRALQLNAISWAIGPIGIGVAIICDIETSLSIRAGQASQTAALLPTDITNEHFTIGAWRAFALLVNLNMGTSSSTRVVVGHAIDTADGLEISIAITR